MEHNKRIEELEDLLRSAKAIALRRGGETDWERFANRCTALGINAITPCTFRAIGAGVTVPPGYFRDPDGDLHESKPVTAIWIGKRRWPLARKRHVVRLEHADRSLWTWDFATAAEAEEFRDELIECVFAAAEKETDQ